MFSMHENNRLSRTFSILYSDNALEAMSTASCCIFSSMSAFLITAFRCSLMLQLIIGRRKAEEKIFMIKVDNETTRIDNVLVCCCLSVLGWNGTIQPFGVRRQHC